MGKRIVKLITRFVGNKCVVFDGSRVYYWDVPMIILPMDALSFLQKELESCFGKKARDTIFYLGKIQGKNGCNILIQKFKFVPEIKDISFFMEQTEFVGIGKTSIVLNELKKAHMIFSIKNSPNAKAYLNMFGKSTHPSCDYVRGLYCGAIEAIANAAVGNTESLLAIETKCMTKGDSECVIEIQKSSQINKALKKEYPSTTPEIEKAKQLETLAKLVRTYSKNIKNSDTQLSAFFRSKNLKRPFVFTDDGKITLVDMESLITPIDILMLLYYVFEKNSKTNKIFYDTGVFLGKSSSARLVEKYALKKDKLETQKMLIEQVGLFGLGKVELVHSSIDSQEYLFYVYNSPGVHYKDLLGTIKGKSVDYFLAGILNGVLEYSYDAKFETIEQNCVVSGSSYCSFVSKKVQSKK